MKTNQVSLEFSELIPKLQASVRHDILIWCHAGRNHIYVSFPTINNFNKLKRHFKLFHLHKQKKSLFRPAEPGHTVEFIEHKGR